MRVKPNATFKLATESKHYFLVQNDIHEDQEKEMYLEDVKVQVQL